jgi:hydrogenase 3 maturation protease
MESWRRVVSREVRGATRVAIVGVGNIARGDDAAGVLVARHMLDGSRPAAAKALVIAAGRAPENYTGVVRAFGPDLVVLVDSAGAGRRPGSVFLVDRAAIADDDVSTHGLPLARIARYIEETMPCRVLILGIEPSSFEGKGMSPAARRAVRNVVKALEQALTAAG